jgi:hypothetical protein
MISKSNKFVKYASIAAIAIVALAASLSSNNINLGKNLLRASSSDTIHGSITFSRTTGTQVVRSNNYYYTSGSTTTGGTIYLRNASNVSLGNNYVAAMCGTFDKGSIEPLITFTVADSGTSQFGFQYISSITLTGDSTREVMVSKSDDGTNWNDAGTVASGSVNTNVAGAKFLKLTYSNNTTLKISSFTITYYCSASGTPGVPGEKSLTGISVKTAPTTTVYTEGEYFDPTGLAITAFYDDLSSEDIAYDGNESEFAFTPSLSTALTASDESVTISYGSESCNQSIVVNESQSSLSGKYSVSISTYQAILDFDLNKFYTAADGSSSENYCFFTYSINNDSITFVIDGEPIWVGGTTRRLFNSSNSNNVGSYNSSTNQITVKLFYTFGSERSASYTFTK